MIWFLKSNYEKILAVLAVAVLILGLGWAWRQQRELVALNTTIGLGESPTGRTYAPASWHAPVFDHANWPQAPEQSAGTGWLYELFTPPEIYYNTAAHSFTVFTPHYPVQPGEETNDPPAGANPGPFRLQLAGYFGSPDNYLVAFVPLGSRETLLARVGRRFPELGLTLVSFTVKKVPVEHGEPWPVYDIAGLATLRDERTGAEVVLDTRARKLTEDPLAVRPAPATEGEPSPVTLAGRSGRAPDFPVPSESGRGP